MLSEIGAQWLGRTAQLDNTYLNKLFAVETTGQYVHREYDQEMAGDAAH